MIDEFVWVNEEGHIRVPVPRARPVAVAPGSDYGKAVEAAVGRWAGTQLAPDFVLNPQQYRKGAGVREISDGMIHCGNRLLIIQVKARDAAQTGRGEEAATRWAVKYARKAGRQVRGTARQLAALKSLEVTTGRCHTTTLASPGSLDVRGLVILDHHENPPLQASHPDLAGSADLALQQPDGSDVHIPVVSRRDWEYLANQLMSADALLRYVWRVTEEPANWILHAEVARYGLLGHED